MGKGAEKKSSDARTPVPDWDKIADAPEFRELIRKKARFIMIATVFFSAYYFALPILTGYFKFLNHPVIGSINGAYLFALSQFFMAWILSLLYVRHASKSDKIVDKIKARYARRFF